METDKPVGVQELVGESMWSRTIRAEIARVASYHSTVLITGPSGTGKELIARTIHAQSRRADKPFIPVDCTVITESLLSSQLFGHVKGAFTGATFSALGCFRAAEGGTLFLDELGELQPQLQAKLLRVIQERAVVPVGSYQAVPVNVRIIAATNRDLKRLVVTGAFREDLYYRLVVFPLNIPALKQRREDIAPLAHHLLQKLWQECGLPLAKLSPQALMLLQRFDWPGNVRQLRHVLEQAVISSRDQTISGALMAQILRTASLPATAEELRVEAGPVEPSLPAGPMKHWPKLNELEQRHILLTLEATGYKCSVAARLLGISRQALNRRIEKYHIAKLHHGRARSLGSRFPCTPLRPE